MKLLPRDRELRDHPSTNNPGSFAQFRQKALDNDRHSRDFGDPSEIDASNDFIAGMNRNGDGIPAIDGALAAGMQAEWFDVTRPAETYARVLARLGIEAAENVG